MFASADPQLPPPAASASVPSMGFMVLLGLAVAMSVQVVGALLVLSLLVVPSAAALRVSSRPLTVVLLSGGFAVVSAVGGIDDRHHRHSADQPLHHHAELPVLRRLSAHRPAHPSLAAAEGD